MSHSGRALFCNHRVLRAGYDRQQFNPRHTVPVFRVYVHMLCCALASWLSSGTLHGDTLTNDTQDAIRRFKGMSLDELLNERVVTVSRSAEQMATAPAAIQVVTSEDIKRSSATTLPSALRLASNLQVARVNADTWAISARGFNNNLANKLLVMIDGRTVYTPLYAGVFWDVQNVLLEDIDRIEVVSGPGGTLWGANAVNGVINVITKSARDTQGTYISGAAGSFLQDFAAVRYGGGNGSNLFFRVYGQRFDFNSTKLPNGHDARDEWEMTQGGFRMDWDPSQEDTLTLQGDFYGGSEQGASADTTLNGQNVLGRWTRVFSPDSDFQAQMYLDRTKRRLPNTFSEDLTTYDLDLQRRFPLSERQSITWGGEYRLMLDRINNSAGIAFLPSRRNMQLFSIFLQDEITLVPDTWKLTLGSKFEHNDYSGFEFQPSARLAWMPDERQTVWTAVSRAVRSPSRIDTEAFIPAPPVSSNTPHLSGGPGFDSEKLLSFELGYRVRPAKPLLLSIATFYNFYDELRSFDQPTTNTFVIDNSFRGETWGVELSAEYVPTSWWRLRGGYAYLDKNLETHGGINVRNVPEGNDPEHQFSFQSILDLPANFQLDLLGRYVDGLPSPSVPDYFNLDVRLAWEYKNVEIAIIGQHLTAHRHSEFGTGEIPRGVYGKVTLRF